MVRTVVLGVSFVLAASLGVGEPSAAAPEQPKRGAHEIRVVSEGIGNQRANAASREPVISGNSRYVAFRSAADNLVKGDRNGRPDVFRYDLRTRTTLLVSQAGRRSADGASRSPALSNSGRYVVYQSTADDLAGADDRRPRPDIFRYDAERDTTMLVSRPSKRGRYPGSRDAEVSANGRWVVYASRSARIVRGDSNASSDIFLFDASTKRTVRISSNRGGEQRPGSSVAPAISANGRFISYTYRPPAGSPRPAMVFRYGVRSRHTMLVSRTRDGAEPTGGSGQSALSGNGGLVVFGSSASNLAPRDDNDRRDVFLFDVRDRDVRLLSKTEEKGRAGNGASGAPDISRDGEHVVFESTASDLGFDAPDRPGFDTFTRYLRGSTVKISDPLIGRRANGPSRRPASDGDGSVYVFESAASNLVQGDTGIVDVFMYGWI